METAVVARRRPPVLLARAVWPVLRADRAVRRVVALGFGVRLALAAVVPVFSWLGDGSDPDAFVAGLIGTVLLVAWMTAGAITKVALLRALDARRMGALTTARGCLVWALRRGRAITGWALAHRRRHLGDSWSPEAAFVLPVLADADADVDLTEARRRSEALYRARWGTAEVEAGTPALIGAVGLLVALVVAFPAIALTGAVSIAGQLVALTVLVAALTAATLARALIAYAVYRRELDGEEAFGLSAPQLGQLVAPRR